MLPGINMLAHRGEDGAEEPLRPALAGKVLNYVILHPVAQALLVYAGKTFQQAHRQTFVEPSR